MVAPACKSNTQETESELLKGVQGQPGLLSETWSQENSN